MAMIKIKGSSPRKRKSKRKSKTRASAPFKIRDRGKGSRPVITKERIQGREFFRVGGRTPLILTKREAIRGRARALRFSDERENDG